ncbi:MAG: cytochrome c oxidase subunit II [Rhizorhabdus sp.]|jgi:cytochrome c oxidase subunit 2|uniref:cytochrome c oxidase subunit II n=1 Tax=Rhizorhabdus sp. TaxID=1968843 RepID=UPI001B6E32C3|nr:cytochrome c oxidase subunit II [Rhizorhabdus sp.]MBP8235118.1 cytochrome c oxidase subunit II [Rhizorhabdus sp.]
MKTLKTIMMALSLASTPAALYAQEAVPAAPTAEAAAPAAAAPAAPAFQHRAPEADIGQPIPGGFKLQPQVTKVGEDAQWLHDSLLMPIITIITIFVLLLLVYAVIRFRAKANPVPSRTSHNTLIEIVWTLVPVLILLVIAVPSIRLVAAQYAQPKADLTIKAIGNQWYWTYQYPDNGDFELVSNMLPDAEAKKRGEPRMLAVDERVVVPVNSVVKMIVTSNDVIHSWAVPAFWTKMDAVPGRLNETWFKAEREGLYYGQCSELCGARHGYMPIAVEVVSKEKFAEWVRSKGGSLPGEKVAEAAVPAAPAAAEPAAPATEAAPAAPATSQPATAQN